MPAPRPTTTSPPAHRRLVGGCAALALAGALVAGCGGGLPATRQSGAGVSGRASVSVASAGQAYLAIADQVDAAAVDLTATLAEADSGVSTDDLVDNAEPFIVALGKARSSLVLADWPAVAAADIAAQITASETLIDALSDRSVQPADWVATVRRAGAATAAVAARVRKDLHLPAVDGSAGATPSSGTFPSGNPA